MMNSRNSNVVPTPGYNTKIPDSIMTPDKVETRIGTLEFFDGIRKISEAGFSKLMNTPNVGKASSYSR